MKHTTSKKTLEPVSHFPGLAKQSKVGTLQAARLSGFTLIEIMVVITISVGMMALIITGYRRVGSAGAMERSATKLAQDIRIAQALALSADATKFGGLPPCGFGVHAPDPATGNPNSYVIYAKTPSSTSVPCGVNPPKFSQQWVGNRECLDVSLNPTACPGIYQISTSTVKRFVLSESGIVRFASSGGVINDIYFEPPDPKIYILQANPGGSASTVLTATDANSFKIESVENPAITRTVQVANSGRVQIIGGQILSKPCVPLTCSSFTPAYECGAWADSCGGTLTCGSAGACITPGDACCLNVSDPLCNPAPPGVGVGHCYAAPPADPSGLIASSFSASQINLTWTDNALNESSYVVERAVDGTYTGNVSVCSGLTYTVIAPAEAANSVSYANTGLSTETAYCYRVKAKNVTGDSGYSNFAYAATRPSAPDSFRITNSSWSYRNKAGWGPSCNKSCSYQIQRCLWDNTLSTCVGGYSILASLADINQYLHCDTNRATALTCTGISTSLSPCKECDINSDTANDTPLIAPNPPDERYVTIPDNTKIFPNTYYKYILYADNTAFGGGLSVAAALFSAGSDKKKTGDILPNIPTGLIASAVSASQINLSWTDDADLGYGDETAFLIYRCTGTGCNAKPPGEGGSGALMYTTPTGNDTTWPNTGLAGDTTHGYCIQAQNGVGVSNCSVIASGATLLGDPSGLIASPATVSSGTGAGSGASTVYLAWTNPSPNISQTNVRVERSSGAICKAIPDASVLIGKVTAYTDIMSPALLPNTTYAYQVKAYNGSDSAPSNCLTLITPNVPPGTPGIAGSVSGLITTLTWTDNANLGYGDEDEFIVYRCDATVLPGCQSDTDGAPVGVAVTSIDSSGRSATNAGLAETTYRYCIKARRIADDTYSACSNVVQTSTSPAAPTLVYIPSNSTTSTGLISAQVRWTDNAAAETQNYIARGPIGGSCTGGPWTFLALGAVGGSGTTRTDPDIAILAAETKYCYLIRTDNAAGSVSSNSFVVKTWLPTPTGLFLTPVSAGHIDVNWTDNASTETGYKIERCTGSGCVFTVASQIAVDTDGAPFNNTTGLSEGTTYCYRVRATSPEVDSPYSATACATTPPNAPTLGSVVTAWPATGLLMYWPMNESIGTTANDVSGFGYNGTLNNGPIWTTGKMGPSAVNLDGTNDYIVRALDGTTLTNLTVSFWVKPSATVVGQRGIFQWATTLDSGTPMILVAREDNTTNLRFYVDGNYRLNVAAANGSWTHVALTLSGSATWKFYINGALAGTWTGGVVYQAFAANVYLGNGYTGYFPGAIDDLRIYNTTLNSSEIATLASSFSTKLTWTDNSGIETQNSIVRGPANIACPASGGPWAAIGLGAASGGAQTSYDTTVLAPETRYCYMVRAEGSGGTASSAGITVKTLLPYPTWNTALSGPDGNKKVDLYWADNSTTETSFEIQRCSTSACTTVLATATSGANSTSLTGWSVGTSGAWYYYRIRAIDATYGADSPWSSMLYIISG